MELSVSPPFPGGKRRGRSRDSGLWFLGVRPGGVRIWGGGRSGAQRRSPRVMGSGPLKQFPLRRDVGRFLKEKTHNPGIDRVGHLRQVFGGFRFCFPTFWTPSAPHKAASMKRGGGRVSYLYPGHPLPVPRGRLACCRPVTPGSRNGGGGPCPSRPSRLTSVTGPWEVPPPPLPPNFSSERT